MKYDYDFYEKEFDKLIETCNNHCLSMPFCADFCELMAPLCNKLSPDGALKWLKRKIIIELSTLELVESGIDLSKF